MLNTFLEALHSGDLQAAVTSQFGQILIVVLGLVLLLLVGKFAGTKKFEPKVLVFSALLIAMAYVLSNLKLYKLPQGGSITILRMLMISLIGSLFGLRAGFAGAFAYGLLELVVDPYVVHPMQLLMDYLLAFGALGLSGVFKEGDYAIEKGFVLASLGRLFFAFLSGVIFFAEYAPEGWNPVIYALYYNASYILPEAVITLLLLRIPAFKKAILSVKTMVVRA